MNHTSRTLSAKIAQLFEEQLTEVERCVDSRTLFSDLALVKASGVLSEPAFATVWNNPEDDVYDAL